MLKQSNLMRMLEEKRKAAQDLLNCYRDELRELPTGSLVVNRQPKGIVFYEYKDGVSRGITKETGLVLKLARAQYLHEKRAELEKISESIVCMRAEVQDCKWKDIRDAFEEKGLDLREMLWSPFQRKNSGHQSQNTYKEGEKVYATKVDGIMMRSKSERAWGNLYEEALIPYAYEHKITLDVTGMKDVVGAREYNGRFYKDYYPDFIIFLADGSILVHEHLGRIDLAEYREKTAERIIAMISSGFIKPEQLILTFEDDVKDTSRFMEMIHSKILPYVW